MRKKATAAQATENLGEQVATAKLLYSPKAAATILEMGLSTLYELMLAGEIASFKQGRSRRIPRQALEAYVARQLAEQGVTIGAGGEAA